MAYTVQELRTALSKAEAANDEPAIRELKSAILRRSRVGLLPELQRDYGAVENLTRGFGSGFTQGFETGTLGVATVLEEQAELKAREKIQALGDTFTPEGGDKDSITYNLASAVGSTVGGLGATLAGGAVAGIPGAALAGGAFGLATMRGEASERARDADATLEERNKAINNPLIFAAGALESVPFLKAVNRINKPTADKLSKLLGGDKEVEGLLARARSAGATGGVEAVQELAQNTAQNIVERGYNPDKELSEGSAESAGYGFGAGAILQLFLDALPGKQRGGPDVEEDTTQGPPKPDVEEDTTQGPPKPDDLDARVRDQAARDRRTDPQGDLFPADAEDAARTQGPDRAMPSAPPMYDAETRRKLDAARVPPKETARDQEPDRATPSATSLYDLYDAETRKKIDAARVPSGETARDRLEDEVRAEAKKREEAGAVEFTEEEIQAQIDDLYAKDDIKQRDLFGTPAKALDEAADPKLRKDKPKELPQPTMVGTPEGRLVTESTAEAQRRETRTPVIASVESIIARTKKSKDPQAKKELETLNATLATLKEQQRTIDLAESESVVGDKPSDKVVAASAARQASQAEQKARDEEASPQVDMFSTELQAARKQPKPVDVITNRTLDQLGVSKGNKLRKQVVGKEVSDPTVQTALSETTVRDPAVRSRLTELIDTRPTPARRESDTPAPDVVVSKKVLNDLGVPKNAPVRAQVQGEKRSAVKDTLLAYARKQGQAGLTTDARNKIISFAQDAPAQQGVLDVRPKRTRRPKAEQPVVVEPVVEAPTPTPAKTQSAKPRGRPTVSVKALASATEQRKKPTTRFTQPFAKGTTMRPFTKSDRKTIQALREERGLSTTTRAKKANKMPEFRAKVYLKRYDSPTSALLAAIDESARGPLPKRGDRTAEDAALTKDTTQEGAKQAVEWFKKNTSIASNSWIEAQESALEKQYLTKADQKRQSELINERIKAERKDEAAERGAARKRTKQEQTKRRRIEQVVEKEEFKDIATADTYALQNQQVEDEVREALESDDPDVAAAMRELDKATGNRPNMLDDGKTKVLTPVSDSVREKIDANDLGGALQELAKTTDSKFIRQMANKLLPFVGDTKVFAVDAQANLSDEQASAPFRFMMFHADGGNAPLGTFIASGNKNDADMIEALGEGTAEYLDNSIVLNPYAYDGIPAEVLLHEVAHAATLKTLKDSNSPFTKRLNTIFEAVKEEITHESAKVDLDEFMAEFFANPVLRDDLRRIRLAGGKLAKIKGQDNILQRVLFALKKLFNFPTNVENEVSRLADEILAPDSGGYNGGLYNADVELVAEKFGAVQKQFAKSTKGLKESAQEGWRKLWTLPAKAKYIAAYSAPSEMLADMADTTDKRLGKVAQELHVEFRKMRGNMEQRMKSVSATTDTLLKWEKSASAEKLDTFNDIVYESTLSRVDPSKKPGDDGFYTGEKLETWREMQPAWTSLGADGQAMYNKLRDSYKAQYMELGNVIKGRIDALTKDNPDLAKELENKVLSKLFDASKIEPYFPLTRFGEYKLGYSLKSDREDGEDAYVFKMFPTAAARVAWVRDNVEGNPDVIEGSVELQQGDKPMDFTNVPPTAFVMQTANMLRKAKGVDDAVVKQFMQSFIEVMPEAAVAKGFATRKGTAGYDRDAMEAFRLKAPQLARQTERMRSAVAISRLKDELMEMQAPSEGLGTAEEISGRIKKTAQERGKRAALGEELRVPYETLRNELLQRADFALNPPNNWLEGLAQRANQLGFVYTIGWNASSAIVNMSQIPLFVAPYLTGEYGARNTTAALHRSFALLGGSGTFKDPLMNTIDKYSFGMLGSEGKKYAKQRDLTGEEIEMMSMPSIDNYFVIDKDGMYQVRDDFEFPEGERGKKMKEEIANLQPLVQVMAEQNQLNSSFISDTMGINYTDSPTAGSFRKLMDSVTRSSAFMFHHVEQYNRQATNIAIYQLELDRLNGKLDAATGLERKPTEEELNLTTEEKQRRAVEYTMREAQRLNGGTNLETTGRIGQTNIGRVAMMYKSYGIRMYSTMLTSAKRMIDKNEDPMVRRVATRQLIGVTGSSIFFAGLRGFPLYGAFTLVANMILDDEEDDADTIVREYIGEGWYKGALTALTGADVSARVALSGLLVQVNRYNHDPSAEEQIGFYVGGPAWSSAKKILRGVDDLRSGEMQRGIENLAPGAVTNVLKTGRVAAEDAYNTRRGDPILEDVSGGALAAQLFGFRPAELSFRQEMAAAFKKQDKAKTSIPTKIVRKIHLARKTGNWQEELKALRELDKWNTKYPEAAVSRKSLNKRLDRHDKTTEDMVYGVKFSSGLEDFYADRLLGLDL